MVGNATYDEQHLFHPSLEFWIWLKKSSTQKLSEVHKARNEGQSFIQNFKLDFNLVFDTLFLCTKNLQHA
jgi:hypothetical protein